VERIALAAMFRPPPFRRFLWLAPVLALATAVLFAWSGADRAHAASDAGEGEHAGTALVAGSICEAQELKAMAVERPDLVIEIPAEFDKPYPSYSACASHELAGDPDAPGPIQPIPFSHAHHAGEYQIECQYCHSGTDRSAAAGVPSVELCMGCHAQFSPDYDQEFSGIRTLKEHWGHSYVEQDGKWKVQPRDPEKARTIEWQQIHRLPEYVKFKHNRHVAAGVDCNQCHGNLRSQEPVKVEELDKLYKVPDTRWWKYGLPTQKLEMGWCIQCHRENGASQDCLTCHY
jgi:hypothetical protein